MNGQRIGYVRISSLEQIAVDRTFTDHASEHKGEIRKEPARVWFIPW